MVELQPSKLATWVRFPSPAPMNRQGLSSGGLLRPGKLVPFGGVLSLRIWIENGAFPGVYRKKGGKRFDSSGLRWAGENWPVNGGGLLTWHGCRLGTGERLWKRAKSSISYNAEASKPPQEAKQLLRPIYRQICEAGKAPAKAAGRNSTPRIERPACAIGATKRTPAAIVY